MKLDQKNHRTRAIALASERGIARARDFTDAGIPLTYLRRMTDAGDLVKLSRGLYQLPDRVGEHVAHDLAEATRLIPSGVISLLSALRYHGLTTQLPSAVWITIPHKARTPRLDNFPLEIVRATGDVLASGIEVADIEGVEVKLYSIAKTIADCFKHRRHVGEDVAIEALIEALREKRVTEAEVMRFAEVDRVADRVRQYLKVL